MKVQKKERTDNPLTDHSDEPAESIDIVKAPSTEGPERDEKVVSTEPAETEDEESGELTPRQQRRKDRYDEMQRRADEAERRALEAEHRAAAALAYTQFTTQQQPADPLEAEEKKVKEDWEKHMALADVLSKGSTPEQQQQWKKDFLEIQQRHQSVIVKKELKTAGLGQGQQMSPGEQLVRAHVEAHHPDFIGNRDALMYADGVMKQRLVRERRQSPTIADYDAVFSQTRRELRMPGAVSSPPSQATRQKFSGHGLGGASGATPRSEHSSIAMNEDMQRMAEAAYSRERDPKTGRWRQLKPAEAHARWAQRVGKKVSEKYQ